jgi:hypothetical protein
VYVVIEIDMRGFNKPNKKWLAGAYLFNTRAAAEMKRKDLLGTGAIYVGLAEVEPDPNDGLELVLR